mmetsp:Transcript_5737/g.10358  ORF Transcript_5737/g.10358 Transcript_5737/m.10358 type:complete len:298 (+) Transcript_5737:11-904(+)
MMSDIDEKIDALERTVLEIDAMASIFCNDFSGESEGCSEEFVITNPDALECARERIDNCPAGEFDVPHIDAEVLVRSTSESSGVDARLRMCLPPGYPSSCHAVVTVLCAPKNFPRNKLDELSTKLQCRAKELIGSEAILEIINKCRDEIDHWEQSNLSNPVFEEACEDDVTTTKSSINRRWIWVHHITNSGRLKQIVTEAQSLKLGGFLKGGYPGVVVVEGSRMSCDEFVTWIKGNKSRPGGFGRNWGHHVRGEATVELRQLPEKFEELEDDMGKLGSLCTEFGVEDEFREFILQHK